MTADSLIKYLYRAQTTNNIPINYTKDEFYSWILSLDNFKGLYDDWVQSDYNRWLKPSVKRVNPMLTYTLDNIVMDTFKIVQDLSHQDIVDGNNTKLTRAVIQLDLNGKVIAEYFSMKHAERITGIRNSGISNACRGFSKTSGGYKWIYK